MNDLISIIVPIYQVDRYLDQCIQSIRNQTYKNLEIILVDDGSNDRCPQICDVHAKEDKRIIVIHKENGGLDSARKAGISVATGKYVGYIDGDDWVEPNMYEMLFEYARKYNVDVVESGAIDSYKNKEWKRKPFLEEGCYKGEDFIEKVEPNLLYSGSFFEYGISAYLWSKLFLKEKIYKYQMIEDLTNIVHNDSMVALPCIAETKNIYVSHDFYYHYRVRNGSQKRKHQQDEVANLFKCFPEFYSRFRGTKLCLGNDRQIKYYTMYWLLHRACYVFDDLSKDTILVPYGGLKIHDKIVLYGAGSVGIHLENYIRNIEGSNIVCWMDYNYKNLNDVLNVINPEEIKYYDFDYVIISILRESAVQSAKRYLISLGVPEEKILWIKQEYIDNPEILLRRVMCQGETLI